MSGDDPARRRAPTLTAPSSPTCTAVSQRDEAGTVGEASRCRARALDRHEHGAGRRWPLPTRSSPPQRYAGLGGAVEQRRVRRARTSESPREAGAGSAPAAVRREHHRGSPMPPEVRVAGGVPTGTSVATCSPMARVSRSPVRWRSGATSGRAPGTTATTLPGISGAPRSGAASSSSTTTAVGACRGRRVGRIRGWRGTRGCSPAGYRRRRGRRDAARSASNVGIADSRTREQLAPDRTSAVRRRACIRRASVTAGTRRQVGQPRGRGIGHEAEQQRPLAVDGRELGDVLRSEGGRARSVGVRDDVQGKRESATRSKAAWRRRQLLKPASNGSLPSAGHDRRHRLPRRQRAERGVRARAPRAPVPPRRHAGGGRRSERIILPGVGAARATLESLEEQGLVDALSRARASRRRAVPRHLHRAAGAVRPQRRRRHAVPRLGARHGAALPGHRPCTADRMERGAVRARAPRHDELCPTRATSTS